MKLHRYAIPLVVAALLVPATTNAQERPRSGVYVFGGRGMLGIRTSALPPGSPGARQRLVIDVVKDSPAEKAGVMKGDTVVSINGLAASQQAMNLPFEPGDTVVLRVRRDGRERDLTVVATERTSAYMYQGISPDSIGNAVAIIMDRVRARIDTLHVPRVEVQRFGTDSTHTIIIMGNDTIHSSGRMRAAPWTGFFHADSVRGNLRVGTWPRPFGDSTWVRMFPDSVGVHFDFGGDATWVRPFNVFSYTHSIGMRAVAGAELTELNPGLAEYFGATDGVLVLNAHEGTPANRSGLQAGDVIIRAADTAITSIDDLRRAIQREENRNVRIRVLRNGRHIDLTLER